VGANTLEYSLALGQLDYLWAHGIGRSEREGSTATRLTVICRVEDQNCCWNKKEKKKQD